MDMEAAGNQKGPGRNFGNFTMKKKSKMGYTVLYSSTSWLDRIRGWLFEPFVNHAHDKGGHSGPKQLILHDCQTAQKP